MKLLSYLRHKSRRVGTVPQLCRLGRLSYSRARHDGLSPLAFMKFVPGHASSTMLEPLIALARANA